LDKAFGIVWQPVNTASIESMIIGTVLFSLRILTVGFKTVVFNIR